MIWKSCENIVDLEYYNSDSFEDAHFVQTLLHSSDTNELVNRKLNQWIHAVNKKQLIRNEEAFGKLPSPEKEIPGAAPDFVLVIQVHNRSENLYYLIKSLEFTRHIGQALIVFSMDFVNPEIIRLIDSIRFARTLKIFYQYSLQVFNGTFPGLGSDDCFEHKERSRLQTSNCVNYAWKDQYGHYRTPTLSQMKNHWLWKAKFVFDNLKSVSHYEQYVLFLEEDHYVLEDALHVLSLLNQIWTPSEARGLLALGSYEKSPRFPNAYSINRWSSKQNMGLAISRSVWKRILSCSDFFCEYDDYNWDWTLQYMIQTCAKDIQQVLMLYQSPRVFHVGDCNGIHMKKQNCSTHNIVSNLKVKLKGILLSKLYPTALSTFKLFQRKNLLRPNGGWADPRDKALCHSIAAGLFTDKLRSLAPNFTSNTL